MIIWEIETRKRNKQTHLRIYPIRWDFEAVIYVQVKRKKAEKLAI